MEFGTACMQLIGAWMEFNSVIEARRRGVPGLLCSMQDLNLGTVSLFLVLQARWAHRDTFDSFVMACWASSNSRPALCMRVARRPLR